MSHSLINRDIDEAVDALIEKSNGQLSTYQAVKIYSEIEKALKNFGWYNKLRYKTVYLLLKYGFQPLAEHFGYDLQNMFQIKIEYGIFDNCQLDIYLQGELIKSRVFKMGIEW